MAESDIQLALTKATKLFTMALNFGHFALGADVFLSRSGGGAHGKTLYLPCSRLKVPEVNGRPASGFHARQGEKPLVARRRGFAKMARERSAG